MTDMADIADDTLVARHYETFSEGPRLTKSRVRRLEFDTSLHVLGGHLPPGSALLELGAGHGAYSLHYARRGHRVTATDLVGANVEAMRARADAEGLRVALDVRQADATCLKEFGDGEFGAVLCLGPYYHLRTQELRRRALDECRRVVRAGGIVAVSYINRPLAVNYLLATGRALAAEQYVSLAQPDDLRTDYPDDFFNVSHFSTRESVDADLQACGFETVEHAGTDGPSGFFPRVLEDLDEDAYRDYRAYHLGTGSRAAGTSSHCLAVARRT
ncbi:class I SAM-dependent methyltransferase [Streptoverticillium reticulum]|uniref:class I SAM-dependent methyltransferase n=1 Tax=Streptoverticillium reticulum TaxID=1433415 RepID=UPI0039BFDD7A